MDLCFCGISFADCAKIECRRQGQKFRYALFLILYTVCTAGLWFFFYPQMPNVGSNKLLHGNDE